MLTDILATLAYSGVGIALMAVGYVLVDIATPGKLRDLIWVDRNRNAALLLASGLVGVGMIVVVAIVNSNDDFAKGIVDTGLYGLLGLVVMAVSFVLLDLATPGKLGELLCDPEPHPAVWVSVAAHLTSGAIIAAAIS
ncbi:DUF350 domain-containing protein [Longispora sp. NPDC051575]|uniref:DUF350 domain-containing protein n=1 Tax=Longispora sp. NPDC051575 TaxID=3154943 RepID=UPI003449717A